MARGPERATLEIGVRYDRGRSKWCFVIRGARGRIMHESKPVYDTDPEARAAARDWLTQTMLR